MTYYEESMFVELLARVSKLESRQGTDYALNSAELDALRGRWCDDCQTRVCMSNGRVGEDGNKMPFRYGDGDRVAFCAECEEYLGTYS